MKRVAVALAVVVTVVAGCRESYPGDPPTEPDHGTIYAEVAVDLCRPAECGNDPVFVFFDVARQPFGLRDLSVQAAITQVLPTAQFPSSDAGLIGDDGVVIESGRMLYLEPINMITDRRLRLLAGWDNGKTSPGRNLYQYEWNGSAWINVVGMVNRTPLNP